MATYIQYQLEDGSQVLVEASENVTTRGVVKTANEADRDGNVIKSANSKFEQALANVRGAADALLGSLRNLHQNPDEVEVKFGLKATGEAGVFAFGKLGTEANYEVTLKWKKPKAEHPSDEMD